MTTKRKLSVGAYCGLTCEMTCLGYVLCRWHRGQGRYLRPGQKLHSSIIHSVELEGSSYEPKALLNKAKNSWFQDSHGHIPYWKDLLKQTAGLPGFIERDLYDSALELITTTPTTELTGKVIAMASSGGLSSFSCVHGLLG